jgi:hypothetical protein
MNRNLAIAIGLALSMPAQDTEVKGARITLVPKTTDVLKLTIENRRSSPLVECQVGLFARGADKSSAFSGWHFYPGSADGTVQPNERRTVDAKLEFAPGVETARLNLVVFEDGYYEGVASAVEPWRKDRQARVDDLRYWDGVFNLMPRVSETDLRAYLTSRLDDRAGRPGQDPNGMGSVIGKLRDVLRRYPSGPDVWSGLDRLRAETKSELAGLTAQPAGKAAGAVDAVTSAAILSQERAPSKSYAAAIENLRDVPIEAFGLELVDAGTNRQRSGLTSDLGPGQRPGESVSPRGGPIQPREVREVPLLNADGAAPLVRLAFVIFDDASSEGRAAPRDELLDRRQKRAANLAFAIAALGQAAGRPAGEVEAFLLQKRAERARQLLAEGASGSLQLMEIDELIRQAKESPERLVTNAKARQEELERQRAWYARPVRR